MENSKELTKEVLELLKKAEKDSYKGLSLEAISEVLGFEKDAQKDLDFALSYLKDQNYVDVNDDQSAFSITKAGTLSLEIEEEE